MPEVLAPEKASLEKRKISAAQTVGGSHILSRSHRSCESRENIVVRERITGSGNEELPLRGLA